MQSRARKEMGRNGTGISRSGYDERPIHMIAGNLVFEIENYSNNLKDLVARRGRSRFEDDLSFASNYQSLIRFLS